MPLVPIAELLDHATRGGFAIGYFESWDIESLEGVLDAAEATRSPVILGFNGEFLSSSARLDQPRLALYASAGKAAAQAASVPCGLIWNECPDDTWTRHAMTLGFNLVMPVAGTDSPETYAGRIRAICHEAHARGIAVEAEVGELATGDGAHPGHATDPKAAARFVQETSVDLLAISVGNVHILTNGERALDLVRLQAIATGVRIPLVLHGGTGIPRDSLRQAIECGVKKVNYGTYLKTRVLREITEVLGRPAADPHDRIGRGGPADLLACQRKAVREAVLERIHWLGCAGRA
jgi:fructose/tagatose bisphosphate aldolase